MQRAIHARRFTSDATADSLTVSKSEAEWKEELPHMAYRCSAKKAPNAPSPVNSGTTTKRASTGVPVVDKPSLTRTQFESGHRLAQLLPTR